MKGQVIETALTFFLVVVLVYLGIQLLLKVWWIVVLLALFILMLVFMCRIWKFRHYR